MLAQRELSMEQAGISQVLTEGEGMVDKESGGTVRVIAVTSGKGGVGKTSVVANLACSLSSLGRKVMVLDANLGLGNLDVALGLTPAYNMADVIAGRKKVRDVVIDGPAGIKILPASYGLQEAVQLSKGQKIDLLSQVGALEEDVDLLLIDTGAGITSDVMFFNMAAHEIMIVVSPEQTSLTDAYALTRILSRQYAVRNFLLLVNSVKSREEAKAVYKRFCNMVDKALSVSIHYLGFIFYDPELMRAVRLQKAVVEIFPDAEASRCFRELAREIADTSRGIVPKGNIQFFWERIFQVA